MNTPKPNPFPIDYFAHRGSIDDENTLLAFERALKLGAPGIELDVHYYKERLKVTHYRSLVAKKRTPYFEDVLEHIYDKCTTLRRTKPIINIDLKSKHAGTLVLSHLNKYNISKFIITSFMVMTGDDRIRYGELKTVRELNRNVPIGIIGYANRISFYRNFIKELNPCALITKWHKDRYTKKFVNSVHKQGLYSIPWNITDEESCLDAMAKGADGVIKDIYQDKKDVSDK